MIIIICGLAPNYYDNSQFGWTEKHVDMLKKYRGKKLQLNKIVHKS